MSKFDEGYQSYPTYANWNSGAEWTEWDRGYWQAHDASFVESTDGIEDGYGDFLDYDAVSQGFYDDDPSPYDGTYSEM